MPVTAANLDRGGSWTAECPDAVRPIVRMIDGTALGVHAPPAAVYPPTQYTFCYCTCVPPMDGSRADGPGEA